MRKIIYITFIDFNDLSSGSSVRPVKMHQAFQAKGYQMTLVKGSQNNYLKRWQAVFAAFKEIRRNDYEFCYVEPPSGPIFNLCDHLLLMYIKLRKIPIGLFYRDAYWKFAAWYALKGVKRFVINTMHRFDMFIFNRVCKVIYFPSQSMAELFTDLKTNSDTLPPGTVKEQYIAANNFAQKNLLYIGAVGGANGEGTLLEAARTLREQGVGVTVTLICRRENGTIAKYKKYPWLKVYTNLSGEQLRPHYERATFAVIPRKKDLYMDFSVPIKLMEYISFGLPLIVTDCNEMANIVNTNSIGIVSRDNVEGLVKNIRSALSDELRYAEFKQHVRQYAETNTWDSKVDHIANTLLAGE